MAEAIGAKAIRVMAHLRRNTGRRHISVADAFANAIAGTFQWKPSPQKLRTSITFDLTTFSGGDDVGKAWKFVRPCRVHLRHGNPLNAIEPVFEPVMFAQSMSASMPIIVWPLRIWAPAVPATSQPFAL